MFAAGCKKKAPPPPPPPPPPPAGAAAEPPKPAAPDGRPVHGRADHRSSAANPSTLRWEVTGNATSVSIDNAIGTVQNTGNRRVFPSDSTTYTLTATGPGGSTTLGHRHA